MQRAAAGVLFALGILPLAASAGEITLSFGDAPGGASGGFRVERREAGAKRFEALALVGPGVADFVDRGLPVGISYCYRVRALAAEGESAWSPEVCAVAEAEKPAEPEGPPAVGEPAAGEAPAGEEAAGTAEAKPAEGDPAAKPATPEPRRIRSSGGWLQVLD